MAIFCNKCGTEAIDDQSVFCNKCGAKLIQNIPEKKNDTCPNCGTKILDKESLFCNKCGAPLSKNLPVIVKQIEEPPIVPRSVIVKKRCPACGASIVNESKYYCDSCGAYIRGSDPINSPQSKKIVSPDNRSPRRNVKAKSPFLAVLLSFFIPGSGQCYIGQWWKGIALFIFACFSAALCIIVIGIFPLIIIWLYSMYDAYRAANRINGSYVDVDDNYPSQPFISRSGNAGQKNIVKKSGSKFGLAIIGAGVLFLILLFVAVFVSQSGNSSGSHPATLTTSQIKSQSHNITYSNLMRNPDTYKNNIVYFRGKVDQVQQGFGDNNYILRISTKENTFLGYSDDEVYVNYNGNRLLEGDIIDLWGNFVDLKTYTAVLGNDITIPEINALHVEIFQAKT
jgi:ribosomal protein L37E